MAGSVTNYTQKWFPESGTTMVSTYQSHKY